MSWHRRTDDPPTAAAGARPAYTALRIVPLALKCPRTPSDSMRARGSPAVATDAVVTDAVATDAVETAAATVANGSRRSQNPPRELWRDHRDGLAS